MCVRRQKAAEGRLRFDKTEKPSCLASRESRGATVSLSSYDGQSAMILLPGAGFVPTCARFSSDDGYSSLIGLGKSVPTKRPLCETWARMSHRDPNGAPDRRPIKVGEVWENPVTGERLVILERPWDNPASRVTGELTALVGARVRGGTPPSCSCGAIQLEGALSFEIWWTRGDSNPRPPRCEQWGK